MPPTTDDASETRWAFIGAGKMAAALIRGMVRAGLADPSRIAASDPEPKALEALADLGIDARGSNAEAADGADVVVLAVKPQAMADALDGLGKAADGALVVSIAAGVTLHDLADRLGEAPRLVRVMPNTPALVGEGAAAYCLGPGVTEADEALVRRLLESVGLARKIPEALMDAATGLCGSGPAFVFAAIEALADGGVRAGLPREIAAALAAQTVLGSARMVLETALHPGILKDQVASPGGTTIAGLHALERGGLRAALIDAVHAAALRSAELAAEARRR